VATKQFSIEEAIQFGWATWKRHWLLWIALMVIAFIAESIFQVPNQTIDDSPGLSVVIWLVSFAVSTFVQMGWARVTLRFVDEGQAELADLFNAYPVYLNFLIATLIFTVALAIGFLLLIVPGIIVLLWFGFYQYVIVDRGLGPIEGLMRSMQLTEGVRMRLLLFGLVFIGLNLLGVAACFVGLFVSIPVTMMASAYIYRRLEQQTPAEGVLPG
jgi:uncharacterized membrane protein